VSLEDGANFKGAIEMDPESVKKVIGSATGANRSPATARASAPPQPAVAGASTTPISTASGQSR
jgi:hypothetical protein